MKESLKIRSDKLTLLKEYTDWLLKNHYCDSDVYCEPPTAIDQFMHEYNTNESNN